jgi:hypothetical protein
MLLEENNELSVKVQVRALFINPGYFLNLGTLSVADWRQV